MFTLHRDDVTMLIHYVNSKLWNHDWFLVVYCMESENKAIIIIYFFAVCSKTTYKDTTGDRPVITVRPITSLQRPPLSRNTNASVYILHTKPQFALVRETVTFVSSDFISFEKTWT